MVRSFSGAVPVVYERIRVHSLVTVKVESGSVKFIGPAACYDIQYTAAGPADFRGKSIGIDLKFLDGSLAEGRRTESRATGGLAKEEIVRVCAVHQHRIIRAALAAECEVPSASRVSHDTWSQRAQVDKTPAVQRQIAHGL